MNFENLSFDQKIKILTDNNVKKAISDGKIDEKEEKLFKDYGISDISDSDISDIENSYLELETYLENNKDVKAQNNETPDIKDLNEDILNPDRLDKGTNKNTIDNTINENTKTQFKGSVEPAKIDGESSDSLKSKLKSEQDKLGSIDDSISEAKTAQTEAENEYLEKLKEAAEQDEELKELESKRSDKEAEIAEQESAIAEIDTNITKQETVVKEAETNVSKQKTTVSNVESSLNSLVEPPKTISKTVTDKDGNKKTVEEPNPEYQKYLDKKTELEKNLEDSKAKLQELEESLEKAKKELEKLEESKLEAEEKKLNLEEELADIDLEIEEYIADKEEYADIQKALDKYQEANATLQNLEADKIQIQKNINAYEAAIPKAEAEEKKKAEEEAKAKEAAASQGTNGTGAAGGSNGVGGSSSVGGSSGVGSSSGGMGAGSASKEQEIANAQKEYDAAKTNFDTKNEELKKIYSGEDADVKAAKEKANASFDDLQESLIANGHSDLADKIGNVKTNLDSKMAELDDVNLQILNYENSLSDASTATTKCNNSISAYEGKLSELKGADTSNMSAENKAKLDANIAELESEISTNKEKVANTIKNQSEEANTKIKELKEKKAKLEEEVATLNSELDGLLSQVPADCKAEADAFKTAQKDYTDTKATKEASAKSAVESARTEMSTADVKLAGLKDQQALSKYTVGGVGDYNAELGNELHSWLKANCRNTHKSCLAGISDVIEHKYGKRLGLHAADAADKLAGKVSGYEDIASHFQEVEVPRSELKNLPEGCIIVWDRNNSSAAAAQSGHIVMTSGNGGGGISDHVEEPMHYLNSSVGYRVFVPTG